MQCVFDKFTLKKTSNTVYCSFYSQIIYSYLNFSNGQENHEWKVPYGLINSTFQVGHLDFPVEFVLAVYPSQLSHVNSWLATVSVCLETALGISLISPGMMEVGRAGSREQLRPQLLVQGWSFCSCPELASLTVPSLILLWFRIFKVQLDSRTQIQEVSEKLRIWEDELKKVED